jgi:hypothetical protein
MQQSPHSEDNKPSTSNEIPLAFTESKSPLSRSQQPATFSYHKPVNLNIRSLCFRTVLILFPVYNLLLQAVSSIRIFWLTFYMQFRQIFTAELTKHYAMTTYEGVKVQIHVFSTSTLAESEWSA